MDNALRAIAALLLADTRGPDYGAGLPLTLVVDGQILRGRAVTYADWQIHHGRPGERNEVAVQLDDGVLFMLDVDLVTPIQPRGFRVDRIHGNGLRVSVESVSAWADGAVEEASTD